MEFELKETLEYFGKLQIKAQDFCNKKSPYSEDDIRHMGFLHVLGVIQPLIIIWNILMAVDKNQIPDHVYEPLFGIKKEWVPEQLTALQVFCGISLIVQFHFGLEIFLKNILSKLQPTTPLKFYQIAQELLGKCSIGEKDRKFETLMALTHMRNAYHSNGIHNNKSTKPIFIKELQFEFIQGKKHYCASPQHICVLVDEILSIMEEIVLSKEVLSIKEKIPDQYFLNDK